MLCAHDTMMTDAHVRTAQESGNSPPTGKNCLTPVPHTRGPQPTTPHTIVPYRSARLHLSVVHSPSPSWRPLCLRSVPQHPALSSSFCSFDSGMSLSQSFLARIVRV